MKAFANLDKEGQIRRSKHCATGCIFIAILIIGLLICGNMYVSHKKALCTSTVSGTIYSTHIGGKYSKPTVSAKYIIDGKRYYTTGEGYYSYSEIGKQIPVYYYAKDPSVAYTGKGMRKPNNVIWSFIAIVFIAGCPLFLKQAKMIEKNGRIDMKGRDANERTE